MGVSFQAAAETAGELVNPVLAARTLVIGDRR